MRRSTLALVPLLLALGAPARAKSWCAYPLFVHEWGVQVFGPDGRPQDGELLPPWFHGPGASPLAPARTPVRDLPPDGGERDLPVLHFYAPRQADAPIPVAVEVGFAAGVASRWFPAVDALRPPTPAAPQLVWERLDLAPTPKGTPTPTALDWISRARALPSLWVRSPDAPERFVFYEAKTRELTPLKLTRGRAFGPGHRELTLANTGAHPVHDLVLLHREAGQAFAVRVSSLPPGSSTTFTLEDHRLAAGEATTKALWAAYAEGLVDPASPAPPTDYRWDLDRCVMQRDPAVPTREAEGHRLYRAEVELIGAVWAERLFGAQGTAIVYREDLASLAAQMPLAVYTDMYHFIAMRRAGLALWRAALP